MADMEVRTACDHKLTPDPRSGIRFCSKCGMDERKVKRERRQDVDDSIADAMVDANLSPKFCIEYAASLQAFGRALWARAGGDPEAARPDEVRAALARVLLAEEMYVRDTGMPQPDDLIQYAVNQARTLLGWPAIASSGPEVARPSKVVKDAAYDQIDRFLRNNLDDADYADYSAALDALY